MSKIKGFFSIGSKMNLFIIMTVLVSALGTAFVSFFVSVNQIDAYYKRTVKDTARGFSIFVDGDYIMELREHALTEEYQALRDRAEEEDDESLIRNYLEENGLWEKYREQQAQIDAYLESNTSVSYIYLIYYTGEENDRDMYLLDDSTIPIYETGYYEIREPEFEGHDLSKDIEPTISNGDWGYLCSAYVPLLDSKGEEVCIVGCDIDMTEVMAQRRNYFIYIVLAAAVIIAVVLFLAMAFVNRVVIKPLNRVSKEMKKFRPAENVSYAEAGVMSLDIDSHDEIEDLYNQTRDMQINIIDYLNDMTKLKKDKERAEDDIRQKAEQIDQISQEAYRDPLTSVGSKAAYSKKTGELNEEIAKGDTDFAVVMVDMNDLKSINDKYGHKSGDLYIKGCCSMICEAFKHSPVFRIGGDEFVVILRGQDFENRQEIVEKLRDSYLKTALDRKAEPWKRYSAAVGMAECAADDNTYELVFKRADKAMYGEKKSFKEAYSTYR